MNNPVFHHRSQNRDIDIPDYVFYEYHRYVSFSIKNDLPVLPKEAYHSMSDAWAIASCIRAWSRKKSRDYQKSRE